MMDKHHWLELIALLRDDGVEFDGGLTNQAMEAAEKKYKFHFPPDLCSFLQTALPVGKGFYNWRDGNEAGLREMLDWPLQRCLFDVEHGDFWLPEWGSRPELLTDALRIATIKITEAPKLIPVYSHRYMPEEPGESGNPVFSVHQMDIIYYGSDLDDYLRHEFNLPGRKEWPAHVRPIRFWDPDRFQKLRWTDDLNATQS